MEFTQNEFEEVLNIFRSEGLEILQSMDTDLLRLEKEPENTQIAMSILRNAHSLKGSARMLGFNGIHHITHKIEDAIGLYKEGQKLPTPESLEVISNAFECIRELIEKTVDNKAEYLSPDISEHIKNLEDLMEQKRPEHPEEPLKINLAELGFDELNLEEDMHLKPARQWQWEEERKEEEGQPYSQNAKILKIIEDIKKLETQIEFLPEIQELLSKLTVTYRASESCKIFKSIYDLLEIYKKNNRPFEKDTLGAVEEILNDILKLDNTKREEKAKQIEALIQRIEIVEKISQINIKGMAQRPTVAGFNSQDWFDNMNSSAIKTLRIDSVKLDQLVNQIGELIVTRIKATEQLPIARNIQNELLDWQKSWHKVGHFLKYFDKKYLTKDTDTDSFQNVVAYNRQLMSLFNVHSEKIYNIFAKVDFLYKQMQENDVQLNSVTNELESMVKNMRILPLATIFHLFPRMVHNIAKDKGKTIEFKALGSEVSADKKIIEDIKIPLMHILRNSIDHGIESPREREQKGKNPTGEILVNAIHKEDKIIITIKDDGRGLDVEKIKARALERGFLTADEVNAMSEDQIVNLIFYPGFSTGEVVTELSGRGLGLDIVHTKISQLNGRIDICSEFGKGTVTTIELPATMATIKAFIAVECNQYFAFPASSIKTVMRINTDEVFEKDERNYFIYKENMIPVFTLSQILQYDNAPRQTEKFTMLIIESDNSQIGIIVEKLIGEEEILHKKLPAPFSKIKNVAGITTLANGIACLILNITDILNTTSVKKSMTKIIASNNKEIIGKNKDYRILVIDDSITTRTLQRNILKEQGYDIHLATNALDALDLLKESSFDLIITDNQMPNMTGFEFIKKIKADTHTQHIPIIAITSDEKSIWKKKLVGAGADKFIQKSEFNSEIYLSYIGELLK